jgi:hypothetical protein
MQRISNRPCVCVAKVPSQLTLYLVSIFAANTKHSINSFFTPITFSTARSKNAHHPMPGGKRLPDWDIMSVHTTTEWSLPKKHTDHAAETTLVQ